MASAWGQPGVEDVAHQMFRVGVTAVWIDDQKRVHFMDPHIGKPARYQPVTIILYYDETTTVTATCPASKAQEKGILCPLPRGVTLTRPVVHVGFASQKPAIRK